MFGERGDLGAAGGNWRKHAITRSEPIAQRYAELGMVVRERTNPPTVMVAEHYCPACAGQLGLDVYPKHLDGFQSPRLAQPGQRS